MSNIEEKLNLLKKKKLTAKNIVEQQRNEIRLLKSSLTLKQRLEEIYKKFDNHKNIDENLYKKILDDKKNIQSKKNQEIYQSIDNLSNIIEQIFIILSINNNNNINLKIHQEYDIILKKQKESFQLIKWKLSDIYAHRIADEVSCITS